MHILKRANGSIVPFKRFDKTILFQSEISGCANKLKFHLQFILPIQLNRILRIAFSLSFFFYTFFSVHAQILPGIQSLSSFEEKNTKRFELGRKISALESEIDELYIKDSSSILRDIENIGKQLKLKEDELKKALNTKDNKMVADITQSMQNLRDGQNEAQMKLAECRATLKRKKELTAELYKTREELNATEREINLLLTPKIAQQNFMFYSSICFVVLMSILLGIFYYVIKRDELARKVIFGGETGIQFIALFSIIIAIILFGLTGVLEGKELAALLGSVAGYILGRSKFSGDNGKINPTPSVPANEAPRD